MPGHVAGAVRPTPRRRVTGARTSPRGPFRGDRVRSRGSSSQLDKAGADRPAPGWTFPEAACRDDRRSAMAGTNVGSSTKWGGREATQWRGRLDAVHGDTGNTHAHAEDRRAGCV